MRGQSMCRTLCLVSAAIAAVVGATLLVAPGVIFWLFAIDGHDSAAFLARRASVLLFGCALLASLGRRASGDAQSLVVFPLAFTFLGLAAFGTFEALRGAAGPGIWLAIAAETLLGGGFLLNHRADTSAR